MRPSGEASLFRLGASVGVIGAVLGGGANIVHPAPAERALDAQVRLVASYGAWIPVHLTIAVGGLLVLGGLIALSRSIGGAWGAAIARVALVTALIGVALNTAEMAVDGIGLKLAADTWALAPEPERAAAFYGAYAISRVGAGLAFMQIIVFFGLAVGAFGMAMALGTGYPRWLAVAGVLIGLVNVGVGLARSIAPASVALPIGVSVSLGLVWIAVACVLLWRRAAVGEPEVGG